MVLAVRWETHTWMIRWLFQFDFGGALGNAPYPSINNIRRVRFPTHRQMMIDIK